MINRQWKGIQCPLESSTKQLYTLTSKVVISEADLKIKQQ
jgi:hypothetical protein